MANEILLVSAQAPGIQINVTGTSSTAINLPAKGGTVRIVNEGNFPAFVCISAGGTAATIPSISTPLTTASIVLTGTDTVLRIPSDQIQQITAITRSAGTVTILQVYVSEGD